MFAAADRRPSTPSVQQVRPMRRQHAVRGLAVALVTSLVALGGCSGDSGSDGDGADTLPDIPEVAALSAPEGAAFCDAVTVLAAAKAEETTLRADADADGTSASLLGSQAYVDAKAKVSNGSGQYLTAAPQEIVELAQEKERLDDEVGAKLLAGEELGDDGQAALDRAAAISTRLGEYSEHHCGRVAVPS